jgi:hypothetical protein
MFSCTPCTPCIPCTGILHALHALHALNAHMYVLWFLESFVVGRALTAAGGREVAGSRHPLSTFGKAASAARTSLFAEASIAASVLLRKPAQPLRFKRCSLSLVGFLPLSILRQSDNAGIAAAAACPCPSQKQ